ncbi:hypothetical protein Tco_1005977 [Tanacetum coccineum]|uniref:Uncharacterized protein n=1 Tax=Tanacetum coccineum TaxID=301880 RepID=A0ABQ5FGZ1_9ASTR
MIGSDPEPIIIPCMPIIASNRHPYLVRQTCNIDSWNDTWRAGIGQPSPEPPVHGGHRRSTVANHQLTTVSHLWTTVAQPPNHQSTIIRPSVNGGQKLGWVKSPCGPLKECHMA